MELTDVLSKEEWKQLAEEIYEKFGINGGVNDKQGLIVAFSSQWSNEFCPKIKGGEQSRTICATAHQYLLKEAQEKKEAAIGECDVGFSKFVVPVFYKGEFLGTAGGCGFLEEDGEVDTFYMAKVLNLDEKEIEGKLALIKKLSPSELKEAIEYVKKRIEQILQAYKS